MGSFIAKQPNGLYCRYSSVVDGLTHINMTLDDYIGYIMERRGKTKEAAYLEAIDTIDNYIQPFDRVIEEFDFWYNSREKLLSEIIKMTTDGARYELIESVEFNPGWTYEEYEANPTKYEIEFEKIREEAKSIVAEYYKSKENQNPMEYKETKGRAH